MVSKSAGRSDLRLRRLRGFPFPAPAVVDPPLSLSGGATALSTFSVTLAFSEFAKLLVGYREREESAIQDSYMVLQNLCNRI